MFLILLGIFTIANIQQVDVGLASVYNDKIFACPKQTYQYLHLPTAAHRTLPCGTIINVKRFDVDKVVRAVIADRGPYGVCIPSKYNTRACGHGSKWINGRNFIKKKNAMNLATWRGILDMSIPLARLLGIRNRLIPVVIYTDLANIEPSSINPNDNDPKLEIKPNNINILTLLENTKYDETRATSGKSTN